VANLVLIAMRPGVPPTEPGGRAPSWSAERLHEPLVTS
jgi:hypothetical protein